MEPLRKVQAIQVWKIEVLRFESSPHEITNHTFPNNNFVQASNSLVTIITMLITITIIIKRNASTRLLSNKFDNASGSSGCRALGM